MLELNKNQYYELTIFELENLIQLHFQIDIDFISRIELRNDTYYVASLAELDDQELTPNLIKEVLEDDFELIDNSLWLLQMKKIIPSGNYLISISW